MKIALIGYGKMGKLIEQVALRNQHMIVAKIDHHLDTSSITKESLNGAEVCIDFSSPQKFLDNIQKLAELKQTIIAGTTGWYDQIDLIKDLVHKHQIGFLYGANFSVGVHLFSKIVNQAALMINRFDDYDVAGFEIHHHQKIDSPSGTAKMLAEGLLDRLDKKSAIIYDRIDRTIKKDELQFSSLRVGQNPGEHHVSFDSEADTIHLSHQARNREGFAKGAILAAEWIKHKKGFYHFNDLMEDLFHG